MTKMKTSFVRLLAVLFVLSQAFSQTAAPAHLKKGLDAVSGVEAYEFVKMLASPRFAGRLTGHEGYTAAARWAAEKFRTWGLKPLGAGADRWLLPYPSPYTVIKKAEMTLFLPPTKEESEKGQNGREVKLTPEKEFLPLLFSASGDHTAETVFAGWGISAPELGYDDYAGLDVRGRFVFCFRGTPDGGKQYQFHDEHRTRMKVARDKGALGVIYIYADIASNPNGDWLEGFTPAMVSEKVMDSVLQEMRTTAAELKKSLQTFKRPISFPLKTRVRLAVEAEHHPDGVGYNVAGFVPGTDPKLAGECVVIGGHFDHTGRHMGLLFPGADDNASGSAAVMEVAKAFAATPKRPKRSVVFVLFGGEEMGLQGSTYFANNLPAPFKKVDAMFNFDMVGEGDGIGGGVSAEPAGLRQAVEEAGKMTGGLRYLGVIRDVGVRGSDHAPFFALGVPVAGFHSTGPHLAYHQTGDTIYRINPDIMAEAARLAYLAAYAWADR